MGGLRVESRMKRGYFTGVMLLGVALLAACGGERKPESGKPSLVSGVATEEVAGSSIDDLHEVVGTVRAKTTTALSARMVGTILAIRVREGDRVRAGQELIEIENRDARAEVDRAQAGLREAQTAVEEIERNQRAAEAGRSAAIARRQLARATLARYRVLHERKSISDQEFDEVQAQAQVAGAEAERAERMLQVLDAQRKAVDARIAQADADLAAARIRAGYARIASPIDGVVVARQAEPGGVAMPGVGLLTIEGAGASRLEVAVEESRIAGIAIGKPASVVIDALGAGEIDGRVAEIVPAADPASRTWMVKIELPRTAGLLSGMFGRARLVQGKREAVTVAGSSLVRRGQLTGVWVVDAQSLVSLRLVTVGRQSGERIEVLSGLGKGERVVVDAARIEREGVRLQ